MLVLEPVSTVVFFSVSPMTLKTRLEGFHSSDETAILVHKTITNYGSCFAL